MRYFRMRSAGTQISEYDYIASHPNTSFPLNFQPDDADVILQLPKPSVLVTQVVARDGVEQDAEGVWQYKWVTRDKTAEELAADKKAKVPREITMRQAKIALAKTIKNGTSLLSQVNTAIASLTGEAGEIARIEWEYATSVARNWPLVNAIASILGLTEDELDTLFIFGSTL